MNLRSPWVVYYYYVKKMFEKDPDVTVECSDDCLDLKILVNGDEKCEALQKLFPFTKEFGNVVMNIEVIPANSDGADIPKIIAAAFEGNPYFKDMISLKPEGCLAPWNYAVMSADIVQIPIDTLEDPYGNETLTVEQLFNEVLGDAIGGTTYFCTEKISE